ncbi:MAG: putative DNA binding domain-containing protein [Sutterellaceae bacterium]|nr:putative DNA binding domain-containing protein [Sutterellaceae bacterium]
MYENTRTEWKREFVPELKKTFTAFANTDGGTVLIGVDNSGKLIGLSDPDDVLQKVVNTIRDNIRPELAQYFYADIEVIEGKAIVKVEIQKGSHRPYYILGKGIRPEGVFVRKGSESVSASSNEILELIKTASGHDYEKNTSFEQELSFHQAEATFSSFGKNLTEVECKTLGLVNDHGVYTNLGLLISDQCPFSLKVAAFQKNPQTGTDTFSSREEFTGSLLAQIEQFEDWFDRINTRKSVIIGFKRHDFRSYHPESFREAVVNALVHRDYAFTGSTIVNIYNSQAEVISIGGLVEGLNSDDIQLGISRPRNIGLATIFNKLHLTEGWGYGIRSINAAYANNTRKPQFLQSTHGFKVVLPCLDEPKQPNNSDTPNKLGMTLEISKVLELLRQKERINRHDIETLLGCSQAKAIGLLRKLVEEGKIIKVRDGRRFFYYLA